MTLDLREQLQQTVGDAYRLERELGGGGMSRVFVAHETSLGRKVVIKVLLPELAAGVSVERFRREIQLAAQLQHPHIVPLLAAGESSGLPYFTMPFVVGESLRARVARGELPLNEAVHILRDVVSALAYAHTHGVVHRDIKPDNVLLSGGVAVVTDFGVAKAVSVSSEDKHSTLTSMGVALGTPAYMAPEQATADPQVDHRADIYALGVMAYEMLTGQPPFAGRSAQAVLAAHVVEEPEPVERRRPSLPPALAALIMQCMAKRAADRPQSAAQIMYVLDALGTPSGGTAPTAAVPAAVTAPRPRRAATAPIVATVAVALLAVAAALLLRERGSPAPIAAGSGQPGAVAAPAVSERREDSTVTATPPAERVSRLPVSAPPSTPARDDQRASASEPAPTLPPPSKTATAPARSEAPTLAAPTTAAPVDSPVVTAPVTLPPAVNPTVAQPVTPPDPRPELRALVADYATAIESESVAAIRRVYPDMTAEQQTGWQEFFGAVRGMKVALSLSQLDVAGSSADGQVAGTYTYVNTSTRRSEQRPVSFHVGFRRDATVWRIAQVR